MYLIGLTGNIATGKTTVAVIVWAAAADGSLGGPAPMAVRAACSASAGTGPAGSTPGTGKRVTPAFLALRQARIANSSDLKILEVHNPFPGVSLTELGIMLEFIGYQGSLSYSILHSDIGVKGKLLEIGRSGGAMSGHAITPTFIRLVFEASKGLLGIGGYSGPEIDENRVAYAGVSSVGGHHTFDGYLFLAGGKTENVAKVDSLLAPFDHDSLNQIVDRDLRHQANLKAAEIPNNMTVAFISFRESTLGREYFGIARAPDGRDFPFSASQPLFERLDSSRSDGHPIRISHTLHAIEDWKQIKLQPESFMPATV